MAVFAYKHVVVMVICMCTTFHLHVCYRLASMRSKEVILEKNAR